MPAPFRVRRRDQLEALTSPVRQELVDALAASGPCSVAELAALVGRAPDALYYHVRKLERVGLLVPAGSVKAGRRDAALYDVPGRPVHVAREALADGRRPLVVRSGKGLLRSAQRDLEEALGPGASIGHGRRRRVRVGRTKGWFTAAELAEVDEHVRAVLELFAKATRRPGRRLYTLTYLLTPVAPHERAPGGSPAEPRS